jgi:hypothetical protein
MRRRIAREDDKPHGPEDSDPAEEDTTPQSIDPKQEEPQQQQQPPPPPEHQSDEWYAQKLHEEYLAQKEREDALKERRESVKTLEDDVQALTEQLMQSSCRSLSSSEGDSSDFWRCEECGYDSPMMHRFCGVCGYQRPEEWFCYDCNIHNPEYHRFCGMCGKPASTLDYEDMGLPTQAGADEEEEDSIGTDEEEAIRQAVLRMSHHQSQHPQQNFEEGLIDDEDSFANDSDLEGDHDGGDNHTNSQAGWACESCTYVNENPLFLRCEMCNSARPCSPSPAPATTTTRSKPIIRPPPSSSSVASSRTPAAPTKQKERRFTEIMRLQQGLYELAHEEQHLAYEEECASIYSSNHTRSQAAAAASSSSTVGSIIGGGAGGGEPETDMELALIYAQQERILAEYQKQQQQQYRR